MNRVETAEEVFLCDKFEQKVQFHRAASVSPSFFSPWPKDTFGSPAAITAAFFMFRSFLFLSFTYIACQMYEKGGIRGASRVFAGCHAGSLSKVGSVVF